MIQVRTFSAHREIIFTYDPNRKEKGNDERYMVGKQNTEKVKVICEMEVTLKMIGGKYKPLIIEYLIKEGTKRFNELMRYLSGISQRTLTTQLRELDQDGLIKRTVYAEIPPKVEYSITDKGKTLVPILDLMCEWGAKNMDDRYELTNPQCK